MGRFGGHPGKIAWVMQLAEDMGDEVWTFEEMLEHINRGRNSRSNIERRQLAAFLGQKKCFVIVFKGSVNGQKVSTYRIDKGAL
jgi:hypothetical protein